MIALVLLLGCAVFVAWACVHVHRRANLYQAQAKVQAARAHMDALANLIATLAAENERARRELWGLTQ